jgi:hypothetical protein
MFFGAAGDFFRGARIETAARIAKCPWLRVWRTRFPPGNVERYSWSFRADVAPPRRNPESVGEDEDRMARAIHGARALRAFASLRLPAAAACPELDRGGVRVCNPANAGRFCLQEAQTAPV